LQTLAALAKVRLARQLSPREAFLLCEHHRNKAYLRHVKLFKHRMSAIMGIGRGLLLWLLGVPLPIIILLALFWHS
jgi:hypothetical protein